MQNHTASQIKRRIKKVSTEDLRQPLFQAAWKPTAWISFSPTKHEAEKVHSREPFASFWLWKKKVGPEGRNPRKILHPAERRGPAFFSSSSVERPSYAFFARYHAILTRFYPGELFLKTKKRAGGNDSSTRANRKTSGRPSCFDRLREITGVDMRPKKPGRKERAKEVWRHPSSSHWLRLDPISSSATLIYPTCAVMTALRLDPISSSATLMSGDRALLQLLRLDPISSSATLYAVQFAEISGDWAGLSKGKRDF